MKDIQKLISLWRILKEGDSKSRETKISKKKEISLSHNIAMGIIFTEQAKLQLEI